MAVKSKPAILALSGTHAESSCGGRDLVNSEHRMPNRWPIVLMTRRLGHGGSERQMVNLARSLDPSRFDVRVACFRSEGIRAPELEARGIPILNLDVRSFRKPSGIRGAVALFRYLKRHGIRIVHAFDAPTNQFGVPVARLAGVPLVLSSARGHRGLHPRERRILRWIDGFAHAVVVNCEAMRRHLIDDEGVQAGRIRLCYNGLDTDEFSPGGRPRHGAFAGASLVIGTVGVLRPEKGLVTLVEAFARIPDRPPGVKLAIVGDGPVRQELEERARALGIERSCVFLAARERVAPLLRGIDIFVLPSFEEALSNSLMEAMACGCCAVASNVGGNPELVAEEEGGLLFAAGDAAGLADILVRLIHDEELRTKLAREGARQIRERFSLGASTRRMEEIYLEELRAKGLVADGEGPAPAS